MITHSLKTKASIYALIFLLFSCGGNQKDQKEDQQEAKKEESSGGSMSDAVKSIKGLSTIANHSEDIEKMQKTLSSLKPVNNEQLKAALPATLIGIKRSEFSIGDNAGLAGLQSGQATYDKDGEHSLKLTLTDGAGETGSGIASLQYMGLMTDHEKETNEGFEKNIDLNGQRVSLEESKNGDRVDSKLTSLYNKRFIVSLEGDGIPASDLEKAFKELDLGVLK
ncbi:hypothetical protein SAMN05216436_105181 [bacterium A37T11]|nr:hypothetical protein SAMN05216436_105181 [bacterium A37T11]